MRLDYYVYTKSGEFGIDVFFTHTIKTLQSNANIKLHKYLDFKETCFLFKQIQLSHSKKSTNL